MQALHLLALIPIAEHVADPNAYGFRPARSAADAIEQCFRVLSQKTHAKFILEGDIRKCFDRISHDWLLHNIPMDAQVLRKWLNAGYMEQSILYSTKEGTPQGGIISPTLALMALSGLELDIQLIARERDKIHVVTYADDFIVTATSPKILEQTVKPTIENFLRERGLELSETKTQVSHIDIGFDFLGHQIRKYRGKLLIKPAQKGIKAFLSDVRTIIKRYKTAKTVDLIQRLNPTIRGWANYYRHVVSKRVFSYVDDCIYRSLANWVKRRHPDKNATWWRKHYFRRRKGRNWVFTAKHPSDPQQWVDLLKMGDIPIKRHLKIIAQATPFDPLWEDYFKQRRKQKRALVIKNGSVKIAGKQNHRTAGSVNTGFQNA